MRTIPSISENFSKQVNELIAQHSKAVSEGSATSFEDYKRRCGEIAGLRRALLVYGDIIKAYVSKDYED